MNHQNLEYLESLYSQFKTSPDSVGLEWKRFFEGVEFMKDGSFGLSEKELDVYHLISAYRNYGHFEADLDPLTNTPAPSDQLRLSKFNLTEKDLDQKFQIASHMQSHSLDKNILFVSIIFLDVLETLRQQSIADSFFSEIFRNRNRN